MQVIHDFAVKPQEYFLKGKDNDFPVIEKCPHCHDLMVGHGFYPRYIITIKGYGKLYITKGRLKGSSLPSGRGLSHF